MQTIDLKTVDDFITFYEAIPDEQWCTGRFSKRGKDGGLQHCAIGHLVEGSGNADRLRRLWPWHGAFGNVEAVNDGKNEFYDYGKKPKARILHVLNEIKLASK